MKFIFRASLTILLLIPFVTWADTARPPYDYVINVSGGKYVFVMLANSGFTPFKSALAVVDSFLVQLHGISFCRRRSSASNRSVGIFARSTGTFLLLKGRGDKKIPHSGFGKGSVSSSLHCKPFLLDVRTSL